MKRLMFAGLALALLGAVPAQAQELVRVYSPETSAYIPSATDFGYGTTSVYRPSYTTSYYAPAAPVTTYYAPTTAYYAPTTAYYAPVPTTTYYAPAVPTTTYYAPTTAYYAPAYYGGYVAYPAYVPGRPFRNRWRGW